jgi:hypothetical protein
MPIPKCHKVLMSVDLDVLGWIVEKQKETLEKVDHEEEQSFQNQ